MNRISILTIGDELLLGQITNTNGAWMAQHLEEAGFHIAAQHTCSDEQEDIEDAIRYLLSQSDALVSTGGLGPTQDDRTRFALAHLNGESLSENAEALKELQQKYQRRGRTLQGKSLLQTQLPASAQAILNPIGTAAGIHCHYQDKAIFALPGVPREMKAMIQQEVLPLLNKQLKAQRKVHRKIMTATLPESQLSELIKDWEDELPEHISLAYLPGAGTVQLRLTAQGKEENQLQDDLEKLLPALRTAAGDYIYAFQEQRLEEKVGELLGEQGKTLGTAESCTGGHVAHKISSIPGSSAYFQGSVLAYSNQTKIDLLGVNEQSLSQYGAVSEQVAREMAEGLRQVLGCDYALSTTGIAGPGGGTEQKPVGTVWTALAGPEGSKTKLLRLTTDRLLNIELSTTNVLFQLFKQLNQ